MQIAKVGSAYALALSLDAEPFLAALAELSGLAKSAPEGVFEAFAGLRQVPEQLFCVRSESLSAAGAGEVVVRLEPSDRLLGCLAAARAGDFDRLLRERALDVVGHAASSSGGVATPDDIRVGGAGSPSDAPGSEGGAA